MGLGPLDHIGVDGPQGLIDRARLGGDTDQRVAINLDPLRARSAAPVNFPSS